MDRCGEAGEAQGILKGSLYKLLWGLKVSHLSGLYLCLIGYLGLFNGFINILMDLGRFWSHLESFENFLQIQVSGPPIPL